MSRVTPRYVSGRSGFFYYNEIGLGWFKKTAQ
jgi:hypothetical protein